MDEISEFLLFTVTDGSYFGFYALGNSHPPFQRSLFFTNTLSYLKQPSNLTCRRLVAESSPVKKSFDLEQIATEFFLMCFGFTNTSRLPY